jgi:hypothetical protein
MLLATSAAMAGPASAAVDNEHDGARSERGLAARVEALAALPPSSWAAGLGSTVQRVVLAVEVAHSTIAPAPEKRRVTTIRLRPRPRPGPFTMNLYRPGDFVSQATPWWCVPAATATMMNMMRDGRRRGSERFQLWLHREADRLDPEPEEERDDEPRRLDGMGLTDWKRLLNRHGYGTYRVTTAPTLRGAIRRAARAMRVTGRPVGLVVWRGAHAWVMSGFSATADPAHSKRFGVRSVFIQDVWYPRVSSIWGRSRRPNAEVPVGALSADYLRYDRPGRVHPHRDGRFVLIEPVLPPDTRLR